VSAGFGAVDVHYLVDGTARAALVVYDDATFATHRADRIEVIGDVAAYEPGAFYKRELPALRPVLDGTPLALLIVDGFVDLDPDGRPGLGAHVHDAYGIPVIGVAKTAFAPATHAVQVLRGSATRPLFVTSTAPDRAAAAALVKAMAGPFRLPDALRRVDALARRGAP
jgi:deoxyribonuclease V